MLLEVNNRFEITPVNVVITPEIVVITPVNVVITPVNIVNTPVNVVNTPVIFVFTPVIFVFTPVKVVNTPLEFCVFVDGEVNRINGFVFRNGGFMFMVKKAFVPRPTIDFPNCGERAKDGRGLLLPCGGLFFWWRGSYGTPEQPDPQGRPQKMSEDLSVYS